MLHSSVSASAARLNATESLALIRPPSSNIFATSRLRTDCWTPHLLRMQTTMLSRRCLTHTKWVDSLNLSRQAFMRPVGAIACMWFRCSGSLRARSITMEQIYHSLSHSPFICLMMIGHLGVTFTSILIRLRRLQISDTFITFST